MRPIDPSAGQRIAAPEFARSTAIPLAADTRRTDQTPEPAGSAPRLRTAPRQSGFVFEEDEDMQGNRIFTPVWRGPGPVPQAPAGQTDDDQAVYWRDAALASATFPEYWINGQQVSLLPSYPETRRQPVTQPALRDTAATELQATTTEPTRPAAQRHAAPAQTGFVFEEHRNDAGHTIFVRVWRGPAAAPQAPADLRDDAQAVHWCDSAGDSSAYPRDWRSGEPHSLLSSYPETRAASASHQPAHGASRLPWHALPETIHAAPAEARLSAAPAQTPAFSAPVIRRRHD